MTISLFAGAVTACRRQSRRRPARLYVGMAIETFGVRMAALQTEIGRRGAVGVLFELIIRRSAGDERIVRYVCLHDRATGTDDGVRSHMTRADCRRAGTK